MSDLIDRRAAIHAALEDVSGKRTHEFNAGATRAANRIKRLPSVQPATNCSEIPNGSDDTISRKAAIEAIVGQPPEPHYPSWYAAQIEELPAVQPELDCISRKAAIDEIKALYEWHDTVTEDRAVDHLKRLPSVQPERTCVNCGRTANNGGWYADGRTRCPIEEHYALPKDGYCHLWEKRNVTDDDYPERREE